MPFAFGIAGLLLLVIAIQGTQGTAFSLLKSEFTGNNSFVVFASAIAILGALSFIKPIRPITMGLIGLVILGMILKDKGGFFSQLNSALRNPTAPSTGSAIGSPNPASTTLLTAPSSILGGVQNPYLANPNTPLTPGNEPPATGGGFGQY